MKLFQKEKKVLFYFFPVEYRPSRYVLPGNRSGITIILYLALVVGIYLTLPFVREDGHLRMVVCFYVYIRMRPAFKPYIRMVETIYLHSCPIF